MRQREKAFGADLRVTGGARRQHLHGARDKSPGDEVRREIKEANSACPGERERFLKFINRRVVRAKRMRLQQIFFLLRTSGKLALSSS